MSTQQWPDRKLATLKALILEGKLSASRIGELLEVTRNAVIGKAHRLGLLIRPRYPQQQKIVVKKIVAKKLVSKMEMDPTEKIVTEAPPSRPRAKAPLPPEQRPTLQVPTE